MTPLFQLPTWPAQGRRRTSRAALETAVNAALTGLRSATQPTRVLIVPDAGDATDLINTALDEMGAEGGGHLVVQRASPRDPVTLSGIVQLRWSDVTLELRSPIHYTATGSLRIRGQKSEFWRGPDGPDTGTIPAVRENAFTDTEGRLVLPMRSGEGTRFQVGDFLVIRGLRDLVTGTTLERQYTEVIAIDGDDLICADPPLHAFLYDYGQASLDGEGFNTTNVRVMRAAAIASATIPGQYTVPVADTGYLAVGDLCFIDDQRREVDLNPDRDFDNPANMEIARIAGISGNEITFETALRRSYLPEWNARVTKLEAVERSHIRLGQARWTEPQTARVVAVQIDYGAHCSITVGEIDGSAGRIGQALRLSYSYDCHVTGGYLRGAWAHGSGEGYGATLYYATSCSVSGLRISGQRHSILFQATTDCAAFDNESTDELITGIDTHGTACLATVIRDNRISGGARFAPGVTQKAGIRIGNSAHVVSDRDTVVEGNLVSGFSLAGCAALDVVGPARGTLLARNVLADCAIGLRRQGNSAETANTQHIDRLDVRDNSFVRVAAPVDLVSDTSGTIGEVVLAGNVTIDCQAQFRLRGLGNLIALGNRAFAPAASTGVALLDLEQIGTVTARDNHAGPLEMGVSLADCPGARIFGNDFGETTLPIADLGGNTGALLGGNNGGAGGTLRLERVPADLAGPLEISAVIPHDNSAPDPTLGTSVLSTTLATAAGEVIEIEAVLPYVQLSGSTGPVTAHLFAAGATVASTTERITTGGSSGSPIRLVALVTATGPTLALDLRLGPSVSGPTLTVNAKFAGTTEPFLLLRRLLP
jgi:hypothetical protein